MIKYIFDQHALQYMLEQFPRMIVPELWQSFQALCNDGTIVSHREVQKCLDTVLIEQSSLEWVKKNSAVFRPTTEAEATFLGVMMQKEELDFFNTSDFARRRLPESIPFLLSMAYVQNSYYVFRKNTRVEIMPKVQKICSNYDIKCMEVEECLLKMQAE